MTNGNKKEVIMKKETIYLFYGTENYLIEQEINQIVEKNIPQERDLYVINYDLNITPIELVVEDAKTPPFFSECKVIIARNASIFTAQKVQKNIEHNLDTLDKYMDDPADYSIIIFTVQSEKLDERRKIVSKIKKLGNVKVFTPLAGSQLVNWVINTARVYEAGMSKDTANLMIQIIGPNLQLLTQEISKMATYVGLGGTIDSKTVEELSSRTIEQNIFILIEKVADLNIDEAFKIFYDLLKNKEEPIKILALFTRQFRLMLIAKELNRIGYSTKQIASQLGEHPYSIQLALKQSGKFTESQLKEIVKKIAEIDYSIKTGKIDKILSLEMFLFYLFNLPKQANLQKSD